MGRILLNFGRLPREYLVCILLLVAILVIVIAPEVDLLPTILRAGKIWLSWLTQVATLGILAVFHLLFPASVRRALHAEPEVVQRLPFCAFMNCVQRC